MGRVSGVSAVDATHQAGAPRHGLPGHPPQWRPGAGGQPHGGPEPVLDVQLPGAGPRHDGAQGDLLGKQQQQEEDRDPHGEKEIQVPQDDSLGLGAEEVVRE